jgi:hypothetical protein
MNLGNRNLLLSIALATLACIATAGATRADSYTWQEPAIDDWFYPGTLAPGTRTLAPTFVAMGMPGSAFDPARRGATMAAFRTDENVPTGLAPSRYQINAVRVSLTNAPGNGNIKYDDTYDSFADIAAGTDEDPGRPIELYGVGFTNDYEGFGYGALDFLAPEFEEGTPQFVANDGYVIYPLGDDGAGVLTDVYNSPVGGYDAVKDIHDAEPWNTKPWALGKFEGILPGADVPYDSTATFEVDLSLPGVLDYLQASLSYGTLGFFFSSLHEPSGHSGSITYPQWYNKEHATGKAPTLELDVTLLPESTPGDTNGDGAVDLEDLNNVRNHFGETGDNVIGDANANGVVDLEDLNAVRNNFGAGPGAAVPEPSTGLLTLVVLVITMLLLVKTGRRRAT